MACQIKEYQELVADFVNLGLTKLTSASRRCPCVHALYVGLEPGAGIARPGAGS